MPVRAARVAVRPVTVVLALVLVLSVLSAASALPLPATLSPGGQMALAYGSTVETGGGTATGQKPESKVFYTQDGSPTVTRWWAVLGTSGPSPAAGLHLWELVNHVWVQRVRFPEADPWAKADTLLEGATLYVATRDPASSVPGNPRRSDLYTLAYLGDGAWGSVSGPFPITTTSVETLTIAKDSSDRLWTAFESGGVIRAGYTASPGAPFTFMTISKTNVDTDDIAAVTAFGGDRIGVFWSDQVGRKDHFAWRMDSDPLTADWTIETAYGGGVGGCPTANSDLCADDHLNVKVLGEDVYVAVKTSLNDVPGAPGDPLIVLLHRDATGIWSSFRVSPVSDEATRPIVVLGPDRDTIWVWATRGERIDVWESALSAPGFSTGATTWIDGPDDANDATSTKQFTTSATGVVVDASIDESSQVWHNEFLPAEPSSAPTISAFSPTRGGRGTTVTIDGTGFVGASDVRFAGTSAAFTVVSDSRIAATVPTGTSTGPISVTTPGGTAISSQTFTMTVTFAIAADATIARQVPDRNFGNTRRVSIDKAPLSHALLRFTVQVGDRAIAGATLRLYCVNASSRGGAVFSTDTSRAWIEDRVTWKTAPDTVGPRHASLERVEAGTWVEVTLSSLVGTNGTYSLRITPSSTDRAGYASSEGQTRFVPRLVVTLGP